MSSEPITSAKVIDADRDGRRAVWIVWTIVLLIAGGYHYLKVREGRGAFVRWRPQVLKFWQGENIFDKQMFPNPPIFPISVYPIMTLPESVGAMTWFALKGALATLSAILCLRMVKEPGRSISPWVIAAALALSFRPILSDLHHANNNIIIMTLVVLSLYAWRKGYDVIAGLALALAISYKVTPGLFGFYFLIKRSWRTVGWTFLGMVLFLFVVPAIVIGRDFNIECLMSWWQRILSPYLTEGVPSRQEMNQSLVGVMFRLFTDSPRGGRYDPELHQAPIFHLSHATVDFLVKGLSIVFVGVLAMLCRTKTTRRDDRRLLGEFSLVVLTMLIVSERSWKHHFVTVLLPYVYLSYRAFDMRLSKRDRNILAGSLIASAILMATTSSEMGGLFAKREGHVVAQWYGMFLAAGIVLYITTAWRVLVERKAVIEADGNIDVESNRDQSNMESDPRTIRVSVDRPGSRIEGSSPIAPPHLDSKRDAAERESRFQP